MTAGNQSPNYTDSQATWEEIVADFRRVCHDWAGSALELTRLQEDLQRTRDLWTQADTLSGPVAPAPAKRSVPLGGAVEGESCVSSEKLAAELAGSLIPVLCRQMSRELREVVAEQIRASRPLAARPGGSGPGGVSGLPNEPARIRFDDIPGVIDALLAEERGLARPGCPRSALVLAARPGNKQKPPQPKTSPSRLARGGASHTH